MTNYSRKVIALNLKSVNRRLHLFVIILSLQVMLTVLFRLPEAKENSSFGLEETMHFLRHSSCVSAVDGAHPVATIGTGRL